VKKADHPIVAESEPAADEAPETDELPGNTEKE
jgi:hypothetical protein